MTRHSRDGWFHVEPEGARARVALAMCLSGVAAAATTLLILAIGRLS